ncbi:MAG: S1/P1 nuclease, partial [bacterium]
MNRIKSKWILILLLLCPTWALAWGTQGHQTVAIVAERLMTPAAKQMVDEVRSAPGWQTLKPGYSRYFRNADRNLTLFCLGPDGKLSLIASWADAWREHHRYTGRLHFINTELNSDGRRADIQAACGGDCIVTQLEREEQILKDRKADRLERLQALLWVVHLAGDLHQPLHCADNQDRGGNKVFIRFLGRRDNLHWAWDTGFFHAERIQPKRLAESLLARECTQVPAVGTIDANTLWTWAGESFDVAKTFVYPQDQENNGDYDAAEVNRAWPVVRLQLARAGVRLAALLNQAAVPPSLP